MFVKGLTTTAVLFLCKALLSYQLSLVQGPQSLSVNINDEAILECKFNEPAKECVWSKDGEITIVREPYHYVGNPETGDCSIRISKVDLGRDDGSWKCQFPRLGSSPAVVSPEAKVTVLVPPQEPALSFNGVPVEMGGTLSVESPNENVTVICTSQNGNPASNLYWMIDNEKREGSFKNETMSGDDSNRLYTTESHLLISSGSHLQGSQIKCIAEHPTYNGRLHESYGYFQVHHNTTRVNAAVEGSPLTTVAANPNEKITLYCIADGIPTPSYTWAFQRRGVNTWEDWSNQQNLTVTAADGSFICRAGNEYNIDPVKSFEEIKVEVKETEVTDKNGALNYQSILVLVLATTIHWIFFIF